MAKLKPKEKAYYAHFSAAADVAQTATDAVALLSDPATDRADIAAQLADCMRQAEDRYHSVLTALRVSFITPFERTEIQMLARELAGVVRHLEATAALVHLLDPPQLPDEFGAVTEVLTRASEATSEAIGKLRKLKGIKHHHERMRALAAEAEVHRRAMLIWLTGDEVSAKDAIELHAISDELTAATAAYVAVAEAVETVLITEG